MADLFDQRSKQFSNPINNKDPFFVRAAQVNSNEIKAPSTALPSSEDHGFLSGLSKGYSSGVTGLLAGNKPEGISSEAPWTESLGGMVGKFASDFPAMLAGAPLGAAAGASLGSAVPGIGTAVGGLIGGGAGAMALPTAIDESYKEYYDYAEKGGDLSFGDFIKSIGSVAKETGKQGLLGGAVGIVGKALPYLSKIPQFDRLLQTNLGRKGVSTGLEYGALTLGQAALEGRSPTAQEAVNNAIMIGGIKAATGTASAIKSGLKGKFSINEDVSKAIETHPMVKSARAIEAITPEPVKKFISETASGLKQTKEGKQYFNMLKDHIGARDAKMVESQFKWRESLEKAEEQQKFSAENLEEMMYYRQKTGNPKIAGDTYESLSSRLPESAREFVDNVVAPHLKDSLEFFNKHKLTRKINPREVLEDIYLPGLYENKPNEINKAYNEVSKGFRTKNPFESQKKFLTYLDAFQAKGLKPRYKNIVDLMRAFDNINIKTIANLEFLDKIKYVENTPVKDAQGHLIKRPLIVNSHNKKAYNKALSDGYVRFNDPYLRRYVAGTKDGKISTAIDAFKDLPEAKAFLSKLKGKPRPIYATTTADALVHPELAKAVQGVFRKEPFQDSWQATKAYDALNNEIKTLQVIGSLFHYNSLFNHAAGALGAKKALSAVAPWYSSFKAEADALLKDKTVMMDAARAGLVTHKAYDFGEKQTKIGKALDILASDLPIKPSKTRLIQWGAQKLAKSQTYLWEKFHPRMKIKSWYDMTNDYISREETKRGKSLNSNEKSHIQREMATLTNNIFGGQRWETLRFLNNPKNMQRYRRIIAFPNWTLSTLRAADVGFTKNPSIAQKEARKFWLRYGLFLGGTTGFMKWLYGGLKDDENSPTGVTFDPSKGFKELTEGDPKNWYKIGLPDVNFNILGKVYNPGRSEDGRRLYMQAMKSALELGGWATHPFVEAFKKSNPIIQQAWKQLMDSTPSEDGTFPVGASKESKWKEWGGSKPGTLARFQERAKEAAKSFMPFSGGTIQNTGVLPFVASGLGAFAVSKGMSLTSSGKYLEDAFRNKDMAKVNKIKQVLKDNGYKPKQISTQISKAKHKVKEEST